MDKIITLTYANGTVIELSGVDELTAVMPLIVGGIATVSVRDQVMAPAPVTAVVPVAVPAPATPTLPGLELDEQPKPVSRARPRSVYLTEHEVNIMRVLRQFPDGISSSDIAELLDVDHNHTAANVSQLRTKRPYVDTADPLLVPVGGRRFKVTPFGMRVRMIVTRRPMKANREIGWGS